MKTAYLLLIFLCLLLTSNIKTFAQCSNNLPPQFVGGTFSQALCEGASMTANIEVTNIDLEGGATTLSVTGLPPGAVVTPALPVTGTGSIIVSITYTAIASDAGGHLVIFTASDQCGGISSSSSSLEVRTYPQITCPAPITVQANLTGCMASLSSYGTATITGFPTPTSIGFVPPEGASLLPGTNNISISANNACGSATCSFPITVTPANPPIMWCPADITEPAIGCLGAFVNFSNPSAYSSAGISTLVTTPSYSSGGLFPVGTTTIVATATDMCGSTNTCSFNVTVNPLAPTIINCPQNITTTVTSGIPGIGQCSAVMNITVPATSGAGLTLLTLSNPPFTYTGSGSQNLTLSVPDAEYPVGTTTVTATATDLCGTITTCSFTVTVLDPDPPVITCPANIALTANAAGCTAATDFTVSSTSIAGMSHIGISYPPVSAGSIGELNLATTVSNAVFPQGTTTVVATATDLCGNTSSCSFDVTVSAVTVDVGADAVTIFGYAPLQTVNRTATITGGTPPYSYSWSLSRALKCNQTTSDGDELFSGGSTCNDYDCPTTGTATKAAPACTGSLTMSATLLADADACVTVTDANGCTATDCFHISAVDGRCFVGTNNRKKLKICHRTGSNVKPWIQICIDKGAVNNFIATHPGDLVGPCPNARMAEDEPDEDNVISIFPNPFENTATIRFMLPENDFVNVRVLDVTGREMEVIYEGVTQAGNIYELTFNGSEFAKGMYFLVMNTQSGSTLTHKLILTK